MPTDGVATNGAQQHLLTLDSLFTIFFIFQILHNGNAHRRFGSKIPDLMDFKTEHLETMSEYLHVIRMYTYLFFQDK